METIEKLIFSNSFGHITDKKITLIYKNGQEDIPIKKITSIRYQHKRKYLVLIINLLLSILGFFILFGYQREHNIVTISINLILVFITIIYCISGWKGHYIILISTSGIDRKPQKVEINKIKEAEDFINAVRKSII